MISSNFVKNVYMIQVQPLVSIEIPISKGVNDLCETFKLTFRDGNAGALRRQYLPKFDAGAKIHLPLIK